MADIPKFDAKAQRRGIPEVDVRTGQADAWLTLAQATSSFAQRLGDMADRAAAREGELAGLEAGNRLALPSPGEPPGKPAKLTVAGKGARAKAMAFYMGKGWTREQAAGIVGNLIQESRLDPSAMRPNDAGPGLHSIGIGQWNRERLARLKEFGGGNWRDFETQLAFVDHELRTTEAAAGSALKRAANVDDATAAMIGFERPQGWTAENPRAGHGWANRIVTAQGLFDETGTDTPTVAAPAAPPLRVSPAAGGSPATIQPLVLTRGLSIRDQAFNRAALGAAADKLDVAAFTNLETIAQRYPDQPEQALEAIEAYATSVRSQIKQPELINRFESIVARHRIGIVREAAQKSESNRKNDRQAAFLDNWTTRRTAIVRLARRLPDGGDGDNAVATELAEMEELLSSAGEDLTPKERTALKVELSQDVTTARVMAGFERITDPKTREAYAKSFADEWTKGEGKLLDLTPESFEAIRRDMDQRITRDRVEQEKTARETQTRVDQLVKRLGQGYAVPPDERAALKGAVEATADPALAQNFKFFEALANWQTTARLARPETLTATIAAEEARMNREGATSQDIDALDAMKKLRDTISDGVDKDMLGLAERMNLTNVPGLDPQNFTASLVSRKAVAETIATHYGREPQYFKAGEIEALTRAFAVNPDQLVGFAVSVREAMADKTPDALKQISKQAPLIAHTAGIAFATKDDRLLRETAEAMKRKAVEGYKPVKLPDAARDVLISSTLGPALSRLPETQAAALATADMLFDLRAQGAGADPASEEAKTIYEASLNDALGAEGETGGVQTVNGTETLVPPGLTGQGIDAALNALTDADLKALPPIGTPTGVPVRADDLRNARLVAIGLGQYWVALGDPQSANPRYAQTPSGDFWVLDAEQLMKIAGGRLPDRSFGGGRRGAE